MTEVKIPALGESISSGVIASWHVSDGDYVEKDQLLFELETDKITQEMQADAAGVITVNAKEGEEVEIGAVVAMIDESATAPAGKANAKAAEAGSTEAKSNGATATATSEAPSESASGNGNPAISPAVRRIEDETGIDPATVAGTGKDGRVTKGDILRAQSSADGQVQQPMGERENAATRMDPEQAASSRPPFAPPESKPARSSDGPRQTRKRMSPLRRKIAERLVNATVEAALLTTFNECDMSAVMSLRKKFQEDFVGRHEVKLGFMSFFVKAAVEALKAVPGVNAQIDGDELVQYLYYDIGVAVGTEKGLVVPVIRDCDQMSFAEIEQAIIGKAKAARDGKLTLDDLQGGVFTISNGGIYGSMLSTPLLNMPQAGILGLHNITERPMAVNGEVVIRPMMYLALSYDHRLVDGKEAVTFLVKIKQCIEDPSRLLFGI